MKNSTTFKTLLIGLVLIFANSGINAQTIKTDTIRESRLSNLAAALGSTADDIVSDDEALNGGKWFVSFSAGVNAIAAEGNDKVNKFHERRRAKMQISAGHWFNRIFGVKGEIGVGKVSAYYLAGAIYGKRLNDFDYPAETMQYIIAKDGIAYFRKKFTYMDFSLAAMTDIVQWFDKESRWGVQLYAGPTFAYSFKSQGFDENRTWGIKMGTQIDYKISKNFSILADIQTSFLNESFDGIEGGELGGEYKKLDFLAAATIGLSYQFGNTKTSKAKVEIPVIYEDTYIPQPQIIKEVKAPAKKVVTPFAVGFLIDKSNIDKDVKPQLNKIAEYLKSNTNAKAMLTGYADKGTARPDYNLRLSQRRVDSVKNYLVNECGVAEDRIETSAKGDIEDLYNEDPTLNRVVIINIIEK